jgi:hypothetical protein
MKSEESMAGKYSKKSGTCSKLAGTCFTLEKQNSDQNSGRKKVRNQNNCRIPQNSKWISQPRWNHLLLQWCCNILILCSAAYCSKTSLEAIVDLELDKAQAAETVDKDGEEYWHVGG